MVGLVHLGIGEKGFDHVLTIVKGTFDGEIMDVPIQNRGHLRLLDRRHFAIGEHDKDAYIMFTTEAVNCGAACVTTGSTDDCEMVARLAGRKFSVSPNEEEFEQITEELESYIFEGESGAMKELE